MRYLLFSLLIVFSSFISKANDIYFHDVKFDTGFLNELKINDSVKDDSQKLTFVINVSKSTISVYERADYADALAKGFGVLLGLYSIDDGIWEESDYFKTSIKPHNIGSEMISLSFSDSSPSDDFLLEACHQATFIKFSNCILLYCKYGELYRCYSIPLSKDNLNSWEELKKMVNDKNKIEPYQSTAVRDIRKKKDLTFDDIFYLARASTPLKELKKYYPATYGDDHINVKGTYTLYGHEVSEFMIDKDYKNNWDVSCTVYFGETKSESALKEANKFMQDIYSYLIKRGRNVTMTKGSNSYYPDCYRLVFNDIDNRYVECLNGGGYDKRNGEHDTGTVIHFRIAYK